MRTSPMTSFATLALPENATATAPDGSNVRVLLSLAGGSMAHFELPPGRVSRPVTHRTVEEIWYVVSGSGQMWRKSEAKEQVVDLMPGVCLSIPLGTHFQFKAAEFESLGVIGITMPPWPGESEAIPVMGPWQPSP